LTGNDLIIKIPKKIQDQLAGQAAWGFKIVAPPAVSNPGGGLK